MVAHEFSQNAAGIVTGVVTTFFVLVLALAVATLYQNYQDASNNTTAEANALTTLAQDSLAPVPGAGTSVRRAIANYVVAIETRGFPAVRVARLDPTTDPQLSAVFSAVQRYRPVTTTQRALYDAAVGELNQVVVDRENRVNSADGALPLAFLLLIVFTGVLRILTILLITADRRVVEALLVGAVAAVVGVGWLTVLLLEYPFSGSLSVSSGAYAHGLLAHLVALYR